MNNQNYSNDRPVFKGNWSCAQCGAEITELPFEPDGVRDLFCRDCNRERRQNRPRQY